ncbi:hypothetical protein GMDG_05367 [Pseudogymnoascus destructans 20631-21]|uniref:D-serine dehydratase-like domain-containing protein n=1 Tax=Pseudogymnoascus destructans (strain ATCC MYA-4855 / 20631-21) TaxID=658429 RepID=L8FPA4_PSED2|nr:hypothetical protein GMDG_05367 [Pseudogymnoascus destructans 20631-21]
MATSSLEALEAQRQKLVKQFVRTNLNGAPVPSAILDLSKVKRNCTRMLESIDALGFGWRAHIKTHKNILPLLLTYPPTSRSLLYGLLPAPSYAPRLASLSTSLGPYGLHILLDHPSQVGVLRSIYELSGTAVGVSIKIEMGYQRSGILASSDLFKELVAALLPLTEEGKCKIVGFYSHAGHSYAGSDPATAISLLNDELRALLDAAKELRELAPSSTLTFSVGATPTTTAVYNLLHPSSTPSTAEATALASLQSTIDLVKTADAQIELHAGVYPVLDMQQLATSALPPSLLSTSCIALTILAEVASIYPTRNTGEALITAGSIALGREKCKSYDGWGVVSPWGAVGGEGWVVGSVSQEHGVLKWTGEEGRGNGLEVGGRVRVWPNHACIAGTGFDWYLVVDSEGEREGDVVVDVWMRWRGW